MEKESLDRHSFHALDRLLYDSSVDQDTSICPQFLGCLAEALHFVGPESYSARHLDCEQSLRSLQDEVDLEVLPVPEISEPPLELPRNLAEVAENRRLEGSGPDRGILDGQRREGHDQPRVGRIDLEPRSQTGGSAAVEA